MKFRQYPDQAARNREGAAPQKTEGRERWGQLLSLAPGGVWIVPLEKEATDPKVALFGHEHRGAYWVLESEQERPRGADTG